MNSGGADQRVFNEAEIRAANARWNRRCSLLIRLLGRFLFIDSNSRPNRALLTMNSCFLWE